MNFEKEQIELCRKFGAEFTRLDLNLRLGISRDFFSGSIPLNGLREIPENGICGWYLWAGEKMSKDDDYFEPICVSHLISKSPGILKYLALPPGWRFLIADDYEDIWFDENLIKTINN